MIGGFWAIVKERKDAKTHKPSEKDPVMANESYHEPVGDLSDETREMHRAVSSLMEEFEAVAFKLEKGEVSEIVETEAGFHIIQLIERKGEYVNVRHILLKTKVSTIELAKAKAHLDTVAGLMLTNPNTLGIFEVDIIEILSNTDLKKVISSKEIIEFQNLVRKVPIADNVIEYAIKLVTASRPKTTENEYVKEWVSWGAGPRASQYLVLAAKARAIMEGRFTPNMDDIKASAISVLRHRIIPSFSAEAEGITSVDVVQNLLK